MPIIGSGTCGRSRPEALRTRSTAGSMFTPSLSLLTAAVVGVASDAVRDQVMRHDPFTGVFNGAYINGNVRFNVQDAFLKSDISDDGLTRAFTHMSIRCNPGAPEAVPTEMMDELLAAEPANVELDRQFKGSWSVAGA